MKRSVPADFFLDSPKHSRKYKAAYRQQYLPEIIHLAQFNLE